jgi:hypothetical protein
MIKLVGYKRGDRSHYNKTDVIVQDGEVIGEVEFAYGRSDSSDRWNVWEYVIRLPLKNLFVRVSTSGRSSYTFEKGRAIENITRLLNGAEPTWEALANAYRDTKPVASDYDAYGSCVELTYRVLHGFDKLQDQGEDKTKKLKYRLHPNLSTPSTLS